MVCVERISVCNVTEKLVEHGIYSLPCYYTSNAIDFFLLQLRRPTDVTVTSLGCHSAKVLSTTVGNLIIAMVTDLRRALTYNSRGAWHTVYAMLPSNYK